jgi:hypothetical protein
LSSFDLKSNELRFAKLIRRWESDNNQKFIIPKKPTTEQPADRREFEAFADMLFESYPPPSPNNLT